MEPATAMMVSAGIGAGSEILGSLWSASQNKSQAEKQMDFQKEMSNTSHQREVEDLKKAGLNPILSVNSGSSTPSGASAQIENPTKGATQNVLNTLLQRKIQAEIGNLEQNTATQRSQEHLTAGAQVLQDQQYQWNELNNDQNYFFNEAFMPERSKELRLRNIISEANTHSAKAEGQMWKELGKYGKYAEFGIPQFGKLLGNIPTKQKVPLPRTVIHKMEGKK